MKECLIVLLTFNVLFVNPVFAKKVIIMDTVYYDHDWQKSSKDSAYYYEIPTLKIAKNEYQYIANYVSNNKVCETKRCKGKVCLEMTYYESGYKESEGNTRKESTEGLWKWYFDSTEKLCFKAFYKHGFYNGEVVSYYKNGQVKCQSFEKEYKVFHKNCYTEDGRDTTNISARDFPQFAEGDDKFENYIRSNPGYIAFKKKYRIHGAVYVYTCFDENGNIYKSYVSESLSPEADAEALRLVRDMPKWKPALDEKGMPVKSYRTIDIRF